MNNPITDLYVERKKIMVELEITTGRSDFDACEMVEQALMSSALNNSELGLIIFETKVIGRKENHK